MSHCAYGRSSVVQDSQLDDGVGWSSTRPGDVVRELAYGGGGGGEIGRDDVVGVYSPEGSFPEPPPKIKGTVSNPASTSDGLGERDRGVRVPRGGTSRSEAPDSRLAIDDRG